MCVQATKAVVSSRLVTATPLSPSFSSCSICRQWVLPSDLKTLKRSPDKE